MGITENVEIGNFMFCQEHGSEVCNKCYCDHRMCNNIQIIEKLSAEFPDQSEEDLLDRPPLSDALKFGVESKSTVAGKEGPFYQCRKHEVIDCSRCFDWAKLVIAKMKRQESMKNPNAIPVKTTREDKLHLLAAMGVELPPTTRLPESAILKKLISAIDASQYFSKLIKNTPLDPSPLPHWTRATSNKTLLESVRRGNMAEAMRNAAAKESGEDAFPLYANPFTDVRQTLMSMADFWDQNHKYMIIQDKGTDYAICVRIVEVRVLASGVPMLILLYGRGVRVMPIDSTVNWLQEAMRKTNGMLPQIIGTPEEQNLLLMILKENAKRLSSEYRPTRLQSEKTFMLSFLLPIGPLNQHDVGKLTITSGCVLCGNKTASKCSQCLSVEYCGTVCQKAHWKEHKPMCNSLKGAKWHTVTLSLEHEVERLAKALGQELHIAGLNFMSSDFLEDAKLNTRVAGKDNRPIPANIHGDKPFLIKIQRPLSEMGRDSMMIYDRQRSIQGQMLQQENPETYFIAMGEMQTGPMGLKIYRWAKRTGDLQLSVCFNKAPAQNPQW